MYLSHFENVWLSLCFGIYTFLLQALIQHLTSDLMSPYLAVHRNTSFCFSHHFCLSQKCHCLRQSAISNKPVEHVLSFSLSFLSLSLSQSSLLTVFFFPTGVDFRSLNISLQSSLANIVLY